MRNVSKILKARYALLFLLFMLPAPCLSMGSEAMVLDDGAGRYQAGNYLEIMEDPGGALTIEQVSSREFSRNFMRSTEKSPNYGFTDSAYWVRITVKNRSRAVDTWLLMLDFANLQYIDFYSPIPGGTGYRERKTGLCLPVDTREIRYHRFVFALPVSFEQEKTLYLRFKNEASMTLPMVILSPAAFNRHINREYFALGIFYGMLAILIIYMFFMMLSLREVVYVYYIIYLFSITVCHAIYTGVLPAYAWPLNPGSVGQAFLIFMSGAGISLVQFSIHFLRTEKLLPWFHRAMRALGILWTLLLSVSFLIRYGTIIRHFDFLLFITMIVVVSAGVAALARKFRPARYYVFSWLTFFVSVLVLLFVRVGIVQSNVFSEHAWEAGILIAALVWSYALSDRMNLLYAETKRAHVELEESEERYRLLAENTLDVIWTTGVDLRVTYVNHSIERLLGYAVHEFIGLHLRDWCPSETVAAVEHAAEELKQKATGGEKIQVTDEIQSLHRDGRIIDMEITANPLFDADGSFIGFQGRFNDITKRKRAEAERNRLIEILEATSDLIATASPEGVILYINNAGRQMLGWDDGESGTIRHIADAHPAWAIKLITDEGLPAAIKNGIWSRENAIIDPEGTEVPISQVIMSHKSERGELQFFSTIIRDISMIRKTEEHLRQAQKMESIGILAGGIAHDFNNALGGVLGVLSILEHRLRRGESPDAMQLEKYIRMMQESGGKAANIVQQMLSLARKREAVLGQVDLNAVADHVIEICANTLDKSINYDLRRYKSAAIVEADPVQIEQVLLNICINAGHAMTIMRGNGESYGGILTISIEGIKADAYFRSRHPEAEVGSYWAISVSDTGVGMDRPTMTKVFDPFFTTKGEGRGTGLGLAMAYNIVRQHRGFIDVYSEPGAGTTFKIYIPVSLKEPEAESEEKTRGIKRGSGLILVIDDEDVIRQTATEMLMECGYEVITSGNGLDGAELFSRRYKEIALVVLDMAMPVMSGKEAFIKIKEIDHSARVLLVSGFRQDERIGDVMTLGADGFLEKPYTLHGLEEAVKKIMEKNRV